MFGPRSISETLSSRFGDCKDKTVLLTSVLRHFGLDAEPALTGISQGRAADTYLPGVAAFDHVIVRLETGGETYWLDPTRSYQRGQLQDRSLYQPDYGFALPLEEGTELVAMRNEEHAYPVTVLIEETIDGSEGLEDPGWLDLHVEYTLDEADQVRRFYAA